LKQLLRKISFQGALFLLLIALFAILRAQVLLKFNFQYTDSDQTVMWSGLKDYASGIFHEPRFYGQSYNTFLEALLAVPFYKMGMPAFKILPFITSCLAYFPFLFIASILFFRAKRNLALLVLSIPLLLPTEYHLLTSFPRGFVTGVAVASVSFLMLHFNNKWVFFLGGLTAVLGVSVNTNAILLSGFIVALAFIEYRKNGMFYKWCGSGIFIGFIIHGIVQSYYIFHDTVDIHGIDFQFSFTTLLHSFNQLDENFKHVVPNFYGSTIITLLLFVALGIPLWRKKNTLKAILLMGIPILILITLGLNKTHDGTASVFFSLSRMHLYLPICMAISFTQLKEPNTNRWHLLLLIPVYIAFYNKGHVQETIDDQIKNNKETVVTVIRVEDLQNITKNLFSICKENKVDLLIISNHWCYDLINYGSPVLEPRFPKTLRPAYERRIWRLYEDEKTVYSKILILNQQNDSNKAHPQLSCIDKEEGIYLFENRSYKTIEVLKLLNIPVRKY
jgi:hypothetical protein